MIVYFDQIAMYCLLSFSNTQSHLSPFSLKTHFHLSFDPCANSAQLHAQVLQLRRESPFGISATRKHLAWVVSHFLLDEQVEFVIHRQDEVTVFFGINRQVFHFQRIFFQVEQLNIVLGTNIWYKQT